MKGLAPLFMSALLSMCPQSLWAETVLIYGLPLGGAPSPAIKICADHQVGTSTALCWLGKPFQASNGGMLGGIKIPDERLPAWAAYASHSAYVEKDGTLSGITTKTDSPGKLDVIRVSISSRFGRHTEFKQGVPTEVIWELPEIYIRLSEVGDRCCEVQFKTPDEIAKNRAYWKMQAEKEVARPASP